MAGQETRFSIIIPAYNVADYIETALRSVLSQAYQAWEVIVVDDGSTDGSAAILDGYAKRDSRFRVVHQANAGVSAARNHGIDLAKGDYIVFLDGDDMLLPWTLKHLSVYVEQYGSADIVTYGRQTIVSHTETLPAEVSTDDVVAKGHDLRTVAGLRTGFQSVVGSLLAWNGCYRRALLQKVHFKRYPNGEDMLFGSEAFCASSYVVSTNDVLYRYLVSRPGSAVNAVTMRHVKSVLGVAKEWCQSMAGFGSAHMVADLWRRKFRAYCLGVGGCLVGRVDGEVKANARRALIRTVLEMAALNSEAKCAFGSIRITLLSMLPFWCVFYLLESIPFELRARMARVREKIMQWHARLHTIDI